ncbi:MAG TPA: hypothetical protein VMV72_04595 [Verrucomicrobiae bacterium]|nr:hypothetical protein [Verrucomicrobiae bacterium]
MPDREAREDGKRTRKALGDYFKPQWGEYELHGSCMVFNEAGKKLFVRYSKFYPVPSHWWYDIPRNKWEGWQSRSLVFLMSRGNDVRFVLLEPEDSQKLLDRCPVNENGKKEIHIRKRGGNFDFNEWQAFSLTARVKTLPVPWA